MTFSTRTCWHARRFQDDSLCVEELVAQLVDVVPGLGPLLERKYSLVVSSQVYSKMAASRSLADRWRAHGVALLATRYSAMRVAYLEQVSRRSRGMKRGRTEGGIVLQCCDEAKS